MKEADLDALLAAPDQNQMRLLVQSLTDEIPSLAWRSDLNEKIRAQKSTRPRAGWRWMWRPSLGFAMAAALAVVMYVRFAPERTVTHDGTVEAAMMLSHQDLTEAADVSGPGLSMQEAMSPDTTSTSEPNDWDQQDVASL